jgi:DNA-binding beta-propeller fold protein YncE
MVVDLASGAATTRVIEQPANGPPSWLSNHEIALEVVDRDGQAQVVKVRVDDNDAAPVASGSRGFALAATPDGQTLAVADDSAQRVVVVDRATWWSGETTGTPVESPAADLAVQDVAIDADGTRLAVVYARGDSSTWTLVVSRFADGRWERAASVDLEGETPPTIDWLE